MNKTGIESAVANFRAFLEAASTPEHNERYIDEVEVALRNYAESIADDDARVLYLTRAIATLEYVRAELKAERDGG